MVASFYLVDREDVTLGYRVDYWILIAGFYLVDRSFREYGVGKIHSFGC